jgi:hypothetical protein
MTKENPTLSYFEKLVDKFKQVATHKGYDGTPTMERIDQTLQGIKEKVQSLVSMVSTKVSSPLVAKKDPAHFQNLVGGAREKKTFVEKAAKEETSADKTITR